MIRKTNFYYHSFKNNVIELSFSWHVLTTRQKSKFCEILMKLLFLNFFCAVNKRKENRFAQKTRNNINILISLRNNVRHFNRIRSNVMTKEPATRSRRSCKRATMGLQAVFCFAGSAFKACEPTTAGPILLLSANNWRPFRDSSRNLLSITKNKKKDK